MKTTQILATLQQTKSEDTFWRPRVLSVTSLLVARGARAGGGRAQTDTASSPRVEKAGGAGIFNLSNSNCAYNLNISHAVCGTVVTTALLISSSSFFAYRHHHHHQYHHYRHRHYNHHTVVSTQSSSSSNSSSSRPSLKLTSLPPFFFWMNSSLSGKTVVFVWPKDISCARSESNYYS